MKLRLLGRWPLLLDGSLAFLVLLDWLDDGSGLSDDLDGWLVAYRGLLDHVESGSKTK